LTFIPMSTFILVNERVLCPKHIFISFLVFKSTYSWCMGKKARNLEKGSFHRPKSSPVKYISSIKKEKCIAVPTSIHMTA
jgi:hypothetical protein